MKFAYEVLLIFVLPLIARFFLPQFTTLVILGVVTLITAIICFHKQVSLKDLGFRTDNFVSGIKNYFLVTFLLAYSLFVFAEFSGLTFVNIFSDWHFYGVFILVSFSQEFIFRSYLVNESKKHFKKNRNIAFLNAFLFGLMHTILPNPDLMFILSFIGGFVWTIVYLKHPNIYLVGISHSIINFFAVWMGLFSF